MKYQGWLWKRLWVITQGTDAYYREHRTYAGLPKTLEAWTTFVNELGRGGSPLRALYRSLTYRWVIR